MVASILIADDDAVQRRLVENMVQKCGYEAVVVESGDAAVALLTGIDAPVIDAVVLKPVGIERLQVSLRNALNTSALKGELQRIRHSREGRLTFSDIITRSEAMTGVLRMAEKAAGSAIP